MIEGNFWKLVAECWITAKNLPDGPLMNNTTGGPWGETTDEGDLEGIIVIDYDIFRIMNNRDLNN